MGEDTDSASSPRLEDSVESLQREIQELKAQNKAYVQTINFLSNELLHSRKRHAPSIESSSQAEKKLKCDNRTMKDAATFSLQQDSSCLSKTSNAQKAPTTDQVNLSVGDGGDSTKSDFFYSPFEMYHYVFRNLEREDLDNCQLVCKHWYHVIKSKPDKWPKRVIRCVKIIEKTSLMLTISSKRITKKYAYTLNDIQERPETFFDTLKRFLSNSYIKRIIICNLSLTDDFCRRVANCFKVLNFPEISRVEMLAVNLHHVSPDVFHKFLGQTLIASQYFIDGVRNAVEEHFSSLLLEKPALRNADEFTVYDVRSLDNEDVVLAVGDDVLLNHIFGTDGVPRRNTLYLDSPDISLSFLANCLLRFVECENVDRMISHVEFAHCHEQQVPTLRNITLEYEHNIQVEWSAVNSKTGRVLEARVSRNGDDDDFCHLTLSVQSE